MSWFLPAASVESERCDCAMSLSRACELVKPTTAASGNSAAQSTSSDNRNESERRRRRERLGDCDILGLTSFPHAARGNAATLLGWTAGATAIILSRHPCCCHQGWVWIHRRERWRAPPL